MPEKRPEIAIVVAMDSNNGIGKDGKLPWKIPEDMQHFVEETVPDPVIMGRKTYESIPKKYRPLPDRQNIVISRNPNLEYEGVIVVHSLEEALKKAEPLSTKRISIAGGGEIYKEALSLADILCITRVEGVFDVDTKFPDFEEKFPILLRSRKSSYKGLNFSFEDWIKEKS